MRLNTKSAEQSIDRLSAKIKSINKAVNSVAGGNGVEQKLNKSANAAQKVNLELQKTHPVLTKLCMKGDSMTTKFKNWKSALEGFNTSLQGSNNLASGLNGKISRLVNTYLGIMGTKALINTSDTITSAENKLNNINAKSLGSSGFDSSGNYSQATLNMTQETMDKMYNSAQKVRMG